MRQFLKTGLQAAAARPVLALFLFAFIPFMLRSTDQSFMAHDEGWYAQQARWILLNGDWITQRWWENLQYDRVMGIQWLIAGSYTIFGVGEWSARLPGMLASLGCVLLTYEIGLYCVGRRTALLGAAVLAATPIWMQASLQATQDVPLVFFELLGVWALLRAENNDARRVQWAMLAGAAIGLGFMMKGFMVIPAAAAMAPYMLIDHKRHRHLTNPGLYIGLALGFIPFAIWMGLSVEEYGWFPVETMINKLFFLSAKDFHNAGPFYYLWNIPANAFPWPFLAVPGIVLALRLPGFHRRWLWIGFPVVLLVELTLFRTRVWYYALQLLPYFALAAAVSLVWLADSYRSARSRLPTVLSMVLAALGLFMIGLGTALTSGLVDIGLQPASSFGLIGIFAGTAWLIPLATLLFDRRSNSKSSGQWLSGWLLAPWLAIIIAFATGLWGDYGRAIKAPLQQAPIATALESGPVDFVFPDSNATEDAVLLLLYTPQVGRKYADLAMLPDGALAWVHQEMAGAIIRPHRVIGTAEDWNLVHFLP